MVLATCFVLMILDLSVTTIETTLKNISRFEMNMVSSTIFALVKVSWDNWLLKLSGDMLSLDCGEPRKASSNVLERHQLESLVHPLVHWSIHLCAQDVLAIFQCVLFGISFGWCSHLFKMYIYLNTLLCKAMATD